MIDLTTWLSTPALATAIRGALISMGCQATVKRTVAMIGARLSLGKLDPNHDIARAARMAQLNASIYLLKREGNANSNENGPIYREAVKSLENEALRVRKAKGQALSAFLPEGGYAAVENSVRNLLAAETGGTAGSAASLVDAALADVAIAGGWPVAPEPLREAFHDASDGFHAAFDTAIGALLKDQDWDHFFRIWLVLKAEATDASVERLHRKFANLSPHRDDREQAAVEIAGGQERLRLFENMLNEIAEGQRRIESKMDSAIVVVEDTNESARTAAYESRRARELAEHLVSVTERSHKLPIARYNQLLATVIKWFSRPTPGPLLQGAHWLARRREARTYRRRVRLSWTLSGLGALAIFSGGLFRRDDLPANWESALMKTCWVVYDPQQFDPGHYDFSSNRAYAAYLTRADWNEALRSRVSDLIDPAFRSVGLGPPQGPVPIRTQIDAEARSIANDLAKIKEAGFDGIVTHGSYGPLALIPKIAEANGLRTIMGVVDPTNVNELNVAASQKDNVFAYVIGFSGLSVSAPTPWPESFVSLDTLAQSVDRLRRRTMKPVATEMRFWDLDQFRNGEVVGDWLFVNLNDLDPVPNFTEFPRIYETIQKSTSSDSLRGTALEAYTARIGRIRSHALAAGRPYLFSTVMFPSRSTPGASSRTQAEYFEFMTGRAPSLTGGAPVPFSTHTAFDPTWKNVSFAEWERSTGVLESDGRPREAAQYLSTRRCGSRR